MQEAETARARDFGMRPFVQRRAGVLSHLLGKNIARNAWVVVENTRKNIEEYWA